MGFIEPPLPRTLMARVIFGWILLTVLYYFFTNGLVHQWEQPILVYPEADNTYWLLHALGLPQYIMQHYAAALLFDLALVISILCFLCFPRKIIFALVAIICLWLLQVMYSSANGHHYHHVGLLLLPLPFLVRNQQRFELAWQLAGYWIIFLFVSAGVYKFYYHGVFPNDNMSMIIRHHLANSGSLYTRMTLDLIYHEKFAQWLYRLAAVLQLSCALGFVSRRYNWWVLTALTLFTLTNFVLLHIPFWENSLLLAAFLPWHRAEVFFAAWRTRLMKLSTGARA